MLISGRGSNLKAIISAIDAGSLAAHIAVVISNRADAAGLQLASEAGLDTLVVDHTKYPTREDYDAALMQAIDSFAPDLIVLAGFMRILTDDFIDHYAGSILNIHPSLLPDLKGLNTHQRALEAGYSETGASVHFVNKELDSGAVVLQARVPVMPDDDAGTLASRVLQQEHIIYPMVIGWFAENRLSCDNDTVVFDNRTITQPLQWKNNTLADN